MKKLIAALVAFAVLVPIVGSASAQSERNRRQYTIVDLGTLGGTVSEATGINASGRVVGGSETDEAFSYRAFLYTGGQMVNLGALGGNISIAYDINNAGQVAGGASTGMDMHAVLFSEGQTIDLGVSGVANAINNRGEVAGVFSTDNGLTLRGFLYRNGEVRDIGTLRGRTVARGINDSGEVVGESDYVDGREHAFLYSHRRMRDLGTLGGSTSTALGINNPGTIVGASALTAQGYDGPFHAFVYRHGRMRDLGTLGGNESNALDVNEAGQIVGYSRIRPGSTSPIHAYLYDDGRMVDLNELLPAGSSLELAAALGINNRGQIVGNAYVAGTENLHAFLMSPQ